MGRLFGLVIITVAIAVLFSLWRAQHQMNWIAQAFQPTGEFVEVNGVNVHYLERGQGQPLILIHGLSSNLKEWDTGLVDILAQDYRVIAFDRPGLGYSDSVEGITLRGQAELLSNASLALGARNPIVVGHSFGGAVSLAWAVFEPDNISGLMVLSGASYPISDLPVNVVKLLGSTFPGKFIARMQLAWSSNESLERSESEVFAPQAMPVDFISDAGSWLKMRPETAVENMRQLANLNSELAEQVPQYPDIAIPVIVVHGTSDRIVPYATNALVLTAAVSDASLITLEGIGHEPNVVATTEIRQALLGLNTLK
ncbi:MAG: alpha/beta fold hydrolase [Granulosicoccus sp.]